MSANSDIKFNSKKLTCFALVFGVLHLRDTCSKVVENPENHEHLLENRKTS